MRFFTLLLLVSVFLFLSCNSFAAVIFEDNFNNHPNGWEPVEFGTKITGGTNQNPGRNEPAPWTGYKAGTGASVEIVVGEGRNDSGALRYGFEPSTTWPGVGLHKWLGPEGYSELYIRFYVRYEQEWNWGLASSGYFKVMRLWQNVSTEDVLGISGKTIDDETNRGFMLLLTQNAQGAHPVYEYLCTHNDGLHSAGGAVSLLQYYPYNSSSTQGFLENHFGAIDSAGDWTSTQSWHSIELHVKLASPWPADDGVYELWIDGIKQDKYTNVYNAKSTRTYKNMPTEKLGVGINYFILQDNGALSKDWPTAYHVFYDDVVISTTYVGPEYVIGNPDVTPPSPPTGLRILP